MPPIMCLSLRCYSCLWPRKRIDPAPIVWPLSHLFYYSASNYMNCIKHSITFQLTMFIIFEWPWYIFPFVHLCTWLVSIWEQLVEFCYVIFFPASWEKSISLNPYLFSQKPGSFQKHENQPKNHMLFIIFLYK